MALVRPFRALRPVPEQAAHVAAVPYDVVTTDEARALAAGNLLSFLHVSRAEIDLQAGIDPYGPDVYETARHNFERLKRTAPLIREAEPALYCYRLRMGDREQTGVAGCYSLDEYDRGLVRKHERTRRDKEDDRTRHIIALAAQTGLVFLAYRASPQVDEAVARVCTEPPLFHFTAADEVRHTVWRVSPLVAPAMLEAFGRLPAVYIADGHHRAASAARARHELRAAGRDSAEADWFLAAAFPDDQVQILPYNRIIKDLAGLTPQRLVEELGARCEVSPGSPSPAAKGEVSMYLAGRWYRLAWRNRPAVPGDLIGNLDVSMLQDRIIEPLLKISDVRTDKRIDFVGGARGTAALEQLVDSGQAAVAFSLHPVSVRELMAIADAGSVLPPKSTWFEPKLRDGLLIHEL